MRQAVPTTSSRTTGRAWLGPLRTLPSGSCTHRRDPPATAPAGCAGRGAVVKREAGDSPAAAAGLERAPASSAGSCPARRRSGPAAASLPARGPAQGDPSGQSAAGPVTGPREPGGAPAGAWRAPAAPQPGRAPAGPPPGCGVVRGRETTPRRLLTAPGRPRLPRGPGRQRSDPVPQPRAQPRPRGQP